MPHFDPKTNRDFEVCSTHGRYNLPKRFYKGYKSGCPECQKLEEAKAAKEARKELLKNLILAFQENPELSKEFWSFYVISALLSKLTGFTSLVDQLKKALKLR